MSEVIKLKVAEVSYNKELVDHWDELSKHVREYLNTNPQSGFVVSTYTRTGQAAVSIKADYHVFDPMDAFWLPDMVKEKIREIRDEHTIENE